MPQPKHRYRVSVYLGKENYEELKKLSEFMGLSVGQLARVMLETGMNLSKSMEAKMSNGSK